MMDTVYRAQVELLLNVLPYVAKEKVFALKGGTAINLFVRDNMPRLSVDIDLTYLLLDDRATALQSITDSLKRIKDDLTRSVAGIQADLMPQKGGEEAKLRCNRGKVHIKIEVNTTLRGYLQAPQLMPVTGVVQSEVKLFAALNVVSPGELYGGKICAALDRQHPRDLFDIHQLFANEGITDDIRLGFIAALVGSNRPIHEMLRPNLQNQEDIFNKQFSGMATEPFSYQDFETTRERLVTEINDILTKEDKAFLISLKSGNPDWDLYSIKGLEKMPSVQWKLRNIKNLLAKNPGKHAEQLGTLERVLQLK